MGVVGVTVVLFGSSQAARISAPCVCSGRISLTVRPWRLLSAQSGANRFEFVALLLLTLPVEFTFQVLFALPRLALRRRAF